MKKSKKKKDSNIMTFMKDHNIQVIPENKIPNAKDIKFILVPMIGFDTVGYFHIKNKEIMSFKRATVSYQFSIEYYTDGIGNEYTVTMDEYSEELRSITKLCNMLYSFERYEKVMMLENTYLLDNVPSEMVIYPVYFYMSLYDEDDNIIYNISINPSMNGVEKSSLIDEMKRDIFGTFGCRFKDPSYIVIRNNLWKKINKSEIKMSDIVGVCSYMTNTVVFVEAKELNCLYDSVSSLSIEFAILDMNEYGDYFKNGDFLDQMSIDSCSGLMDTNIEPYKMASIWVNDNDSILGMIDNLKSYALILNSFIELLYKFFSDRYKKMNLMPLVIIHNELLSNSLRNHSDFFVGNDILNIESYISMIHDLQEYL